MIKVDTILVTAGIDVEVALGNGGSVGGFGGVFVGGLEMVGIVVDVAVATGGGVFVSVGGETVSVGRRAGVEVLGTDVAVGGTTVGGTLVGV